MILGKMGALPENHGLTYADVMAYFNGAPYMDADGIWQTPTTGSADVPGIGNVIFVPRGYGGPAPLFVDPADGEAYWLAESLGGSIRFDLIPHAQDGFFQSPVFLLILAAAAVYTGGLAVASYNATAGAMVASGAIEAGTAEMIANNAAFTAWAGGDAATVAAVTAYDAGLSAEMIAAAAQTAAGGVTEIGASTFQFGDTIVELPAPTMIEVPPLALEPFPIGAPYTLNLPDITRTVAKTLAEQVAESATAEGVAPATATAATSTALKTATGALSTAATVAGAIATLTRAVKGAVTPTYNPGVNPATGLPYTVDTSTASAQSISSMLPWLAIAAIGTIALKRK